MRGTFRYCEACVDLAENDESSYRAEFLCTTCLQGRAQHVARLRQDAAYRSHLSRYFAGIPCEAASRCPHHDGTESPFTLEPSDPDYYERRSAIEEALSLFKKSGNNSFKAMEILASHHSGHIQYCGACYHQALQSFKALDQTGFTQMEPYDRATLHNVQLCSACHGKREAFITKYHSHQSAFKEPYQEERTYILTSEVDDTAHDSDGYLGAWVFEQTGGAGPWTGAEITLATIAALNLLVTFMNFAFSRHDKFRDRAEQRAKSQPQPVLPQYITQTATQYAPSATPHQHPQSMPYPQSSQSYQQGTHYSHPHTQSSQHTAQYPQPVAPYTQAPTHYAQPYSTQVAPSSQSLDAPQYPNPTLYNRYAASQYYTQQARDPSRYPEN